tara:strand:- start:447 stop:650 length:204 start_codon:yes stop_codon:yes gene_type:complete
MKVSTIAGFGTLDLLGFIFFAGQFVKEPSYILGIAMLTFGICFVVLVMSLTQHFERDRTNERDNDEQ